MEQAKNTGFVVSTPRGKNGNFYLIMVFLLMFLLPAISIAWESFLEGADFGWPLVGKWVVFWCVGIRLFTAGIKQASNPEYTASNIFKIKAKESLIIIRELGFANIALGVMGILSVINTNWRSIAAITGGIFFGLAGIQHLFKKPDSRNEVIALISDLYVFFVALLYIIFAC
jgi:hypothetical protein